MDSLLPAGLLEPLLILDKIWEDLEMDFVEGLPMFRGENIILVVVDRLSKYVHFIPIHHPFSAIKIATSFVRDVIHLYGISRSIVSDHDTIFLNSVWKEIHRL